MGKKRPTKRNPRNTEQVSRQEHGDPSNTNVHRDVTPPPDQTLVSNTLPATQTLVKKMGEGFRFAKELIPEFDGTNMSVIMFIDQCKVAAALLEPHEMPYLTILIRNKITGPARKYIQDRVGATLDDIFRILQGIYMPREDTSQLTQELANIHRNPGENISDYGTRVTVLLNKIITKVMDKNPGEKGRERCEEYTENAIKNFIRGLDRDTLIFMKDKSPPTLDVAIELAAEADLENKSWSRVHEKGVGTSALNPTCLLNNANFKRVAHIDVKREGRESKRQRLSSLQCFHCKEMGHIKRNYPRLGKEQDSENLCTYCTAQNHTAENCFLRKKHEREIQLRREKFSNRKGNLNSKLGHQNGASMTPRQKLRSESVYSSASERRMDNLQTLQ